MTPLIASGFGYYFVPIAIWASLAGMLYFLHSRVYGSNILSWRKNKFTIMNAFFISIIQIALFVIIGIFTSFGRNPMGSSPTSLMLNSMLLVSTVMALEMGRTFLAKLIPRGRMGLSIAALSVFYAIMMVPANRFAVADPNSTIEFIGVYFLVALAQSILATGLVILGGTTASLAYLVPIMAFGWLVPILPNPTWPIKSLLFTMVPIAGFFAIYQLTSPLRLVTLGLLSRYERARSRVKKEGGYGKWIAVLAVFTVIVWFQSGVFGAQPLVIVSPSMSPSLEVGDVIITMPIQPANVQIGDVITYRLEALPAPVAHRVVDIDRAGASIVITTKGDALEQADRPIVPSGGTIGKVALVIPKIGWLSIYAYQAIYAASGYLSNLVVLAAVIGAAALGALVLVKKRSGMFGHRR